MINRDVHFRILAPAARRRSGMTLIEVLVVVAILALLMAILIPSLGTARQKARRMACASHLRAVGNAINLYRSGLGRYPAPGDRDPAKVFGNSWRPGDPKPRRPTTKLAEIGDLAEALVYTSLGDPWAMYCPSSIQIDTHASKPYTHTTSGGQAVATWRTGRISYMYLVGLDFQRPDSTFPDAQGRPTFNPATESPERSINHANARAVLIGDRVVEIMPPYRNMAESNHGREGGWFLFTTGDAQWWPWERLTVHPTSMYSWYWPRMSHKTPPVK